MFLGPITGSSTASSSGCEQQWTIQLIFLGLLLDASVQGPCVSYEAELCGALVPKPRPVLASWSNKGEGCCGGSFNLVFHGISEQLSFFSFSSSSSFSFSFSFSSS